MKQRLLTEETTMEITQIMLSKIVTHNTQLQLTIRKHGLRQK